MINRASMFADIFSAYGFMNLVAALLCSLALLHAYRHARFLYMRPSMILAGLINLFFQWPLAMYAAYYDEWLPRPVDLAFAVHLPVLAALLAAALMPVAGLRTAWDRLQTPLLDRVSPLGVTAMLSTLGGLSLGMALIYFSYVPFECTGLYSVFNDFSNFSLFREISLKGLADSLPRYTASILSSGVIPIFCMICAYIAKAAYDRRRWFLMGISLLLFTLAMPLSFLNGAKGYLVFLFLQTALLFFWQERLRLTVRMVLCLTLLPLLPAFLFMSALGMNQHNLPGSSARLESCAQRLNLSPDFVAEIPEIREAVEARAAAPEPQSAPVTIVMDSTAPASSPIVIQELPVQDAAPGDAPGAAARSATDDKVRYPDCNPGDPCDESLDQPQISSYQIIAANVRAVLFRVMGIPMMVGGWHVHYTQINGPSDVQGIVRLANWMEKEHINLPNRVALTYGPDYFGHDVIPSMTANVGFIFAYYDYFGLWGLCISIALMLLLDAVILGYRYVSDFLLAPCLAVLSMGQLRMLQADLTVVLVSHGLLISLALLAMLQGVSLLPHMRKKK